MRYSEKQRGSELCKCRRQDGGGFIFYEKLERKKMNITKKKLYVLYYVGEKEAHRVVL